MSAPLDLDAIEARARYTGPPTVLALVAELRTARAERDAAQMKYEMTDGALTLAQDERDALAARIEAAMALRDHVFPLQRVDNEWIDVVKWDRVTAALSGATEPARPESENRGLGDPETTP